MTPAPALCLDANIIIHAEPRATVGGKLAGGIHVATAELFTCSHFLSEDSRIKLPCDMTAPALATFPRFLETARENP